MTSLIILSSDNKNIAKASSVLCESLTNYNTDEHEIDGLVMEEKKYLAQEITAMQSVIMLGKTKVSEKILEDVKVFYEKYNMKYGWLGKKAVLWVENKELSETEMIEIEKLIKVQEKNIENGTFFKTAHKKLIRSNKWVKGGLSVVSPALSIYSIFAGEIDKKKLIGKQYKYLVYEFLKNHLYEFLGIKK